MTSNPALNDFLAIQQMLHASVELLDTAQYNAYIDLYVEGATYKIRAMDRMTQEGSLVLDVDRAGLKARLDLLSNPARVREEAAQSHVVTWGPVLVTNGEAQVSSRFALYETKGMDGISKLVYVGRYQDRLVKRGSDWKIAARDVFLDTFAFRALVVPL